MESGIIVLGGGPGGYYAAIRGAQLGAKVTLVEKEELGGTCLNWGCIPTKVLYRNAEILNTLKNIDEYGIHIENYHIDVPKIQERKQNIVKQLVDGISKLMEANKVEVVYGVGVLKNKNTILVNLNDGGQIDIKGKNIIIATGSKVSIPAIPGADLDELLTSKKILDFTEIPKSLTVIGGGVIGIEFATIFNALGSEVTVLSRSPNILKRMEADLTKRLATSLKKKGITIHRGVQGKKIKKENNKFVVYADTKKGEIRVESEQVLLSSGRKPNIEGINLEGVGINFDKKGIKVNEQLETNINGIYAIGDVIGKNMLAHVASHHGITAAENIMGIESKMNHEVIPDCAFTFPEISSVGIKEEEAKDKGIKYKTSKFLFGGNGKALALGESEGMVKVIANEKDEIIGVHIMGPHASDLIHEGALAISSKMKIDDIAHTIHAHPTLSEAFAEAILGLKEEAIHMIPSKR
ncbi:dihydrolipoamide dehydrogenase [Marinisporobacter balticus]|uniref:Dihydrolipoyl dehydrogenase n=2 Tax=Marinisporobacter balticus TaxID=2018667 RepID=A0A4R2KR54_9FIRM|nr:dihydrolipoamide dehydrogenase [Marinisporobacter balticus]